MEKINSEIIISSLLAIGFDKVDAILYTNTLAQISYDNIELGLFRFDEDDEFSESFYKYITYNGVFYELKKGFSLDSNVSKIKGFVRPLKSALHTNERLVRYLSKLDFTDIILRKIEEIGKPNLEELDILFSAKEKEIMKQIYVASGENKSGARQKRLGQM